MRQSLLAIGTLVGMLILAVGASAWGPRGGQGPRGFGGILSDPAIVEELAERAEIPAEKVEELRNLHIDKRKEMIRLKADVEIAQMELDELLRQPSPDAKAVQKATSRLGDLHTAMLEHRVGAMVEAKGILSEAEQNRIREALREMKGDRGEPRGRGRGRGFGPGMGFQHRHGHGPGPGPHGFWGPDPQSDQPTQPME